MNDLQDNWVSKHNLILISLTSDCRDQIKLPDFSPILQPGTVAWMCRLAWLYTGVNVPKGNHCRFQQQNKGLSIKFMPYR
jgi:hypothetical protein